MKKILSNKKMLAGILLVIIILVFCFVIFFIKESKQEKLFIWQSQNVTDEVVDQTIKSMEEISKTKQSSEAEILDNTSLEEDAKGQPLDDTLKKDSSTEVTEEPDTSSVVMCTPEKEIEGAADLSDEEFVKVTDYIPGIYVELKYATEDNFTGSVIYEFTDAYLRYGTVKKLKLVQELLQQKGYSLKILDAFRPVAAQFVLWEIYPDATYVANPNTGFSSHSRGNTLDVTLVLSDGSEVAMPTEFDDFSLLADRDYSDVDQTVASNALLLETIMQENGFNAYQGEWWHFSDNVKYSVDENFNP